MSKNSQIESMRALVAEYDRKQAAKKGKKAKKAKKSTFAADMRSKREQRWTESKYPSSGMTSKQRRELAATLPKNYSTRQWNKACREFTSGDFR